MHFGRWRRVTGDGIAMPAIARCSYFEHVPTSPEAGRFHQEWRPDQLRSGPHPDMQPRYIGGTGWGSGGWMRWPWRRDSRSDGSQAGKAHRRLTQLDPQTHSLGKADAQRSPERHSRAVTHVTQSRLLTTGRSFRVLAMRSAMARASRAEVTGPSWLLFFPSLPTTDTLYFLPSRSFSPHPFPFSPFRSEPPTS